MFDNPKYITKGVQNEVPVDLQTFLWSCIDKLKEQGDVDYLQVMELKKIICDDIEYQLIVHKQEVPEYKKEYRTLPSKIIETRIFIIDSGQYSTMLLAIEY